MQPVKSTLAFARGSRDLLLIACFSAIFLPLSCCGQVSPGEILNPDLKALEQTYFPQLISINQKIAKTKFPFAFYLSRYVGLDPAKQSEADSRGVEFVRFQDRVILKVSGNYNAAYDTLRLSQNERAATTFRAVILPSLYVVTGALPENLPCDGIGFEVSYHARTKNHSFDYEGKESLVVVLDRDDAWAMSHATADSQRQELLNRSRVYVSGADYGLSLIEREPLNVQTLPRSIPAKPDATSSARSATEVGRSPFLRSPLSPPAVSATTPLPDSPAPADNVAAPSPKPAEPAPAVLVPPLTQADADRLGEKYQEQLWGLAKEGVTKFHFVDYAPPAFVLFHDRLALQLTMRNSLSFDATKSSIYKRAAQSFDLFLAPQLKDLSEKIPAEWEFQAFDISVLNKLSPAAKSTSEAIEFICPRGALKQFVDADITNQQLLDQSVVLVNGVRIALNLQVVE